MENSPIKLLTVVGARPNFMKAAPIIKAVAKHNEATTETGASHIDHLLVHTGQHYDAAMSDQFFTDLGMPKPDVHLGIGSGSHASQTAEIMKKFEEVVLQERPDVVIVVGDVNSTIACALVTSKVSFDASGTRPLMVHVEAGLRSFDRNMPEEVNRVLTDNLSDLLFVTEPSGCVNLEKEGVSPAKVHFVGNTMIDTLLAFRRQANDPAFLARLGLLGSSTSGDLAADVEHYALLTLHRPANVDNREAFERILEGLAELASEWPIVFPVHPRTRKRIEDFGLDRFFPPSASAQPGDGAGKTLRPGFHIVEPLGYLNFVCLMQHAGIVVTDSGGIQEETTCLGVPCVTVRENTERPVTIERGTNVLAGVTSDGIRAAIRRQRSASHLATMPDKWDGQSAHRIVKILVETLQSRRGQQESVSCHNSR